MKRLLLAFLCLLPLSAVAQSVYSYTNRAGTGPAGIGDPPKLYERQAADAEKCDTNASGCTVTPTGITGSARTLADTLGTVLSPSWLAPAYLASALGGVVANDGTDQSAHINTAIMNTPAASGANLIMPCGASLINRSLMIPPARPNVTLTVPNCNHRRVGSQSSAGRARNYCNWAVGPNPQSLQLGA